MIELARPASPLWLDLAACRGKPVSWWFPERGDHFTMAVARSICRSCPVRSACLAEAVTEEAVAGIAFGVRGGVSADARMRLARRQRRAVVEVAPKAVPAPTGRKTWPRWSVATAL